MKLSVKNKILQFNRNQIEKRDQPYLVVIIVPRQHLELAKLLLSQFTNSAIQDVHLSKTPILHIIPKRSDVYSNYILAKLCIVLVHICTNRNILDVSIDICTSTYQDIDQSDTPILHVLPKSQKGYNPVHHTIPNINIIKAEQFIGRVAFIPHKYSAIIQVLLQSSMRERVHICQQFSCDNLQA